MGLKGSTCVTMPDFDNRSNRYGDMAIFRLFKMAAVRHLGFVVRVFGPPSMSSWVVFIVVQHLTEIGRA